MKERLEACYNIYNTRRYLRSDPVRLLHEFPDPHQREVAGLIVSSIAYGRVRSIIKSSRALLERLENRPHEFLIDASESRIRQVCAGFRHRFTGPADMTRMLVGAGNLLRRFDTIGAFVDAHHVGGGATFADAITALAEQIGGAAGGIPHLLPSPRNGSACKRLCLFFRWMVREDAIDPGGWTNARPASLIVPLDVHMMRTCRRLGLTARKNADWKTALEVTEAFRRIMPEDPVKYDFALTRASMFAVGTDEQLPVFASCETGEYPL